MAKVLVWETQLIINDFPPVCAMTGAPAETWRKFTFTKAPPWAFWVGGLLLSAALAERITGHLPLTRASAKKVLLVRWVFAGLIVFGFGLWAVSFAVVSSSAAAFELLVVVGFGAMFGGLIGLLLGRSAMGPRGKLLEQQPGYYNLRMIEIANVHPAFAAAVQQQQRMRAQEAYRQ